MLDSGDPVPRGRVRRTMPLAGFTARAAGGRLVAGLRERSGNAGAVERFHERTAERYAELLGHSKGVLMKAGQLLSMVDASSIGNGGFSPYQKALTRLQADAPPMHPGLVNDVVAADLGRPADQVFAEFTANPWPRPRLARCTGLCFTTAARLRSRFNIRVPRRPSATTWPTSSYCQRFFGSP